MIYLYGLLEPGLNDRPPTLPEAPTGVTGPVEATRLDQGWLIHGPAEEAEIMPRRRFLLAHTRVLEAALEDRALLPMRFGMISSDIKSVARLLDAQQERVRSLFGHIRGRVELGLRIGFDRNAALAATLAEDPRLAAEHARLSRHARPPHFEVAEFGRRLAERLEARRTACQRRLVSAVVPECCSHVLSKPESDVQVLAVEALVGGEHQAGFAAAVQAAAETVRDFADAEPEIRIVGPVPPFNFVRLNLSDAEGAAA